MNKLILLFGLFLFQNLFSQENISFFIYDKKFNVPIEFANAVIKDKYAISDTIGSIKITANNMMDTISISHLSYNSIKVPLFNLKGLLDKDNKIYLVPKIYKLSEIVVTNTKKHYKRTGWEVRKRRRYGTIRTKNGQALTKIIWTKGFGRVQDIKFIIDSLRGDSMLVKLKFYTDKEGKPNELLIKDNIFYMLKHNTRNVTIDLKAYDIKINEDFWVGLQGAESWDKYANSTERVSWGCACIRMDKVSSGKSYYTWYNKINSDEESILRNKGSIFGYSLLIEY
jgi:hypothetical protein